MFRLKMWDELCKSSFSYSILFALKLPLCCRCPFYLLLFFGGVVGVVSPFLWWFDYIFFTAHIPKFITLIQRKYVNKQLPFDQIKEKMRAHKPKCDILIKTRFLGGGGSIYKKFIEIHAFLRPNETNGLYT